MSHDEFTSWLRREYLDLLGDRMTRILDGAAALAACGGKRACSCASCRKDFDAGMQRKSAAHMPFVRRIEWEARGKSIDTAGKFSAYASVFGDPSGPGDCEGDCVLPGAFRDHLGASVPLVWQHSLKEPIGRALELREDSYGLRFVGRLELASPRGQEAHAFLKNAGLDSFSIGYSLPHHDSYEYRSGGYGGRLLKRVRLHEISLVTVACDSGARMVQ